MANRVCVHQLPEVDERLLPGFSVVARTLMQDELLTAVETTGANLILLDLDAPSSVGTILKVREVQPRATIVGVTGRAKLEHVIGAQRAGCAQVTTRPLNPDDLVTALHAALGHDTPAAVAGPVFAVLGSVGGAGATTLAAHLALEIAQRGESATAIFDLDFECGGVAEALGVQPRYSISDVARAGIVDGALLEKASALLPPGLRVFARPASIAEAHTTDETAVQAVLEAAQRFYQFTVLDLPHHLSATAGVAIERCTKLILVVHLTVPSLRNARRIIEAITGEGVPHSRIEVVVNRHGKHGTHFGLEMAEQHLHRPPLITIPNDYKSVHAAIGKGRPLAENTAVRAAIRELARQLTEQSAPKASGAWLPKPSPVH